MMDGGADHVHYDAAIPVIILVRLINPVQQAEGLDSKHAKPIPLCVQHIL